MLFLRRGHLLGVRSGVLHLVSHRNIRCGRIRLLRHLFRGHIRLCGFWLVHKLCCGVVFRSRGGLLLSLCWWLVFNRWVCCMHNLHWWNLRG